MTKATSRTNLKLLSDAKQYLELVGQLNLIRKAIANETTVSKEKLEYLKSIEPIMAVSDEILTEVSKAVERLKAIPSSAPNYKRRAAVKDLNLAMQSHALGITDIMSAVMRAGALYESDQAIEDTCNE